MDTNELINLVTTNHAAVVAAHAKTEAALVEGQKGLKGINANVAALEQKMARRGGGAAGPDSELSWGQTIVGSPEFKTFLEGGARGQQRLELKAVTMTSGATLAGPLIGPLIDTTPTMLPRRKLRIRDLLAPGTCTTNAIWFARQTARTNSASTVSEGAVKPQSDAHFSQIQSPVVTIAHFMQVSRNALDDATALQSSIDGELRWGLGIVEENQLLLGDGTGSNLLGLIPQATAYFAPPFAPTLATGLDTVALSLLQSELAFLPANGVILHPTDFMKMRLLKNTLGEYILGDPSSTTAPSLWGLPVVVTAAIAQGTFLTGAFNLSAQIFDRMAVEVLLSTEAGTNFTSNQITIRAESRLALAVRQPLGLIYGTLP
jgi:HK97 family phage major capsid protein